MAHSFRTLLLAAGVIALSGALPGAAMADGVVMKSPTFDYPVGSVIAEGETVKLKTGETLTILDRSGALVMQPAGKYAAPSVTRKSDAVRTAQQLASAPAAAPKIGGVRTPDDVLPCQGVRSETGANACIAPKGAPGQLRIVRTSGASAKAGLPATLALQATFDGYAVCTRWIPGQDARFLEGADPAHPIALSASTVAQWSGPLTIATSAPVNLVSCKAVSPDVWAMIDDDARATLTPNQSAIVLSGFSRLHGEASDEARGELGRLKW